LSPTDLFFSLRTEAWHFRHLVAESAFLAPQRRQTLRKSRLFWAICFFVTSAIGISWIRSQAVKDPLKDFSSREARTRSTQRPAPTSTGISDVVRATLAPALLSEATFDSAVP
jgi:hypothetical protein